MSAKIRLLAKPRNGQEVIMATYQGVTLGTSQTVFTVQKLILIISRPQEKVGGVLNLAKYVQQNVVTS